MGGIGIGFRVKDLGMYRDRVSGLGMYRVEGLVGMYKGLGSREGSG